MAVRNRVRAPMPIADREQAHYFNELLGRQRAELNERLDALRAQVMQLDRAGDTTAVRHKQRVIKALESEVRVIDRMRNALSLRLSGQVTEA